MCQCSWWQPGCLELMAGLLEEKENTEHPIMQKGAAADCKINQWHCDFRATIIQSWAGLFICSISFDTLGLPAHPVYLQLWLLLWIQRLHPRRQSCSSVHGSCKIYPPPGQIGQSEEIWLGYQCSPSARCQCQKYAAVDKEPEKC